MRSNINLVYSSNFISNTLVSICIPTYNRIDNLLQVLTRMKNLDTSFFSIIVLDNCSNNYNIFDYINFFHSLNLNIFVYQNEKTVFADLNIVRVAELGLSSKWIYLIGDSKLPVNSFGDLLIESINVGADDWAIVFSYERVYLTEKFTSLGSLLQSNLKFGDLLLVGNALMRSELIKNNVQRLYELAVKTRSVVPVSIISGLFAGKSVYLSNVRIIDRFILKPKDYNPGLSLINCWYSFPRIANLAINYDDAQLLNRFVLRNESWSDLWIFFKFCIIKIYRNKINLHLELILILRERYHYAPCSIEKILIYVLIILNFLRFTNEKIR